MADKIEVGTLVAEKKTFVDKEKGTSREYFSYSVTFESGAVVRFVPMQNDRSLLAFALELDG